MRGAGKRLLVIVEELPHSLLKRLDPFVHGFILGYAPTTAAQPAMEQNAQTHAESPNNIDECKTTRTKGNV